LRDATTSRASRSKNSCRGAIAWCHPLDGQNTGRALESGLKLVAALTDTDDD
jgi:hypothetical protein